MSPDIGRVQYLYTIEHAVENIEYHKISIDLCHSRNSVINMGEYNVFNLT